jgi:hypothetical protein
MVYGVGFTYLAMLSLPSVKTYEVTMTCEAPASMYFRALEGLMPPPTCRVHGNSKKVSALLHLLY